MCIRDSWYTDPQQLIPATLQSEFTPVSYTHLDVYKRQGLDQVAVRKAIAIAVDYPTIIANAMTNQSATFTQVPRSLMNPAEGEQAMYCLLDTSRCV